MILTNIPKALILKFYSDRCV